MTRKKLREKTVEILKHDDASRKNIPTAEFQSVMRKEEQTPIRIAYERRNRDLDPQLVWRGKDEQDWSDLVVHAPPLYIQEKVHPKVLIDDLMNRTEEQEKPDEEQADLFSDFNGLPSEAAKTEFYQHDANWSNRMILGDSLQVMASLVEREGLRGQVQCIYIDPPYGIKFNSNFQWSTTSRDVKDGKADHITREPEQVKAFRDTWRDGIHSYLNYLRDRLTVARDLLVESGSIFVQIGDENVHRIRAIMDEVFGEDNFIDQIIFQTSSGRVSEGLDGVYDIILWYGRNKSFTKFRKIKKFRTDKQLDTAYTYLQFPDGSYRMMTKSEKDGDIEFPKSAKRFRPGQTQSQSGGKSSNFILVFEGKKYNPPLTGGWRTSLTGFERAAKASRLIARGRSVAYRLCNDDNPMIQMTNIWTDTVFVAFGSEKTFIVQTNPLVIQRCILMTTDPGDLVLDPTCGSGTTAYVAEQWGRRWITIDTSRVAHTLARARIMGARYPYFLLADSRDGQLKEANINQTAPSEAPTYNNIRQGFVYERVPHITLKSIANNTEINVIWEKFQEVLEPLREKLNSNLGGKWEEWEIPRESEETWKEEVNSIHGQWWVQRIARQKEIDASIATKADCEYLYDKPYVDNKKVRVAGPFTIESLSPHRVLVVNENDELIEGVKDSNSGYGEEHSFIQMILENLKTAGVQQAHKEDKINFMSITPWPGHFVCADGRYVVGDKDSGATKRAAIFIGPEFGTVSRSDLVAAAREAGDADFDTLITCAFNYDAHSSEFEKLGRLPVLKARMNADLHMADDLKNTGKGNLFVIFGEPDIDILEVGENQIRVKINGVDVFHPNTGEVRSDGAEGIACWFIDSDYNEESFFVRHAYFLGANDPYKSLKTTLRAEINQDAWDTLNSDISRPFDKPSSGRIAVKVINHLGDEVMKVYKVE
ncbi:site-specific DNA-methyltransferase [bacterium]